MCESCRRLYEQRKGCAADEESLLRVADVGSNRRT